MRLEVRGLDVRYGKSQVLFRLDLEVGEGELIAVVGANGAGKSTTLKTISGLLRPSAGGVFLDGERISDTPVHERAALGISHVPEGRGIFVGMTVQENLEMGSRAKRVSHAKLAGSLERVYGIFPRLADRRLQDAGTLSGGEQQMLAIGRALVGEPRILLLDEPSMGLAPIIVEKIFEIIKEIHDAGVGILLVEQNALQALRLADRAYVLETGSIKQTGAGSELLHDPAVREAYLGGAVG